jgi:hypothetical protein
MIIAIVKLLNIPVLDYTPLNQELQNIAPLT